MNDSADWTAQGLSPALSWDKAPRSADGAVVACPQCTDQHLHLEQIRYATPADGRYTPTIGVSIDGTQIATPRRGRRRSAAPAQRHQPRRDARHRLLVRERLPRPHRTARTQRPPLPQPARRAIRPARLRHLSPRRRAHDERCQPRRRRHVRASLLSSATAGSPPQSLWPVTKSTGSRHDTREHACPFWTESKGAIGMQSQPPRRTGVDGTSLRQARVDQNWPDTNNPACPTCTTAVATDNVLPNSL